MLCLLPSTTVSPLILCCVFFHPPLYLLSYYVVSPSIHLYLLPSTTVSSSIHYGISFHPICCVFFHPPLYLLLSCVVSSSIHHCISFHPPLYFPVHPILCLLPSTTVSLFFLPRTPLRLLPSASYLLHCTSVISLPLFCIFYLCVSFLLTPCLRPPSLYLFITIPPFISVSRPHVFLCISFLSLSYILFRTSVSPSLYLYISFLPIWIRIPFRPWTISLSIPVSPIAFLQVSLFLKFFVLVSLNCSFFLLRLHPVPSSLFFYAMFPFVKLQALFQLF